MHRKTLLSACTSARSTLLVTAASIIGGACAPADAGIVIPLDPRRTYLHTGMADWMVLDATPLSLAALGIAPGDRLLLRQLGDFDNGPGSDEYTGMLAVFSSSTELLPGSNLVRVPGALDAGVDQNSYVTCPAGEHMDIAEDFAVSLPGQPLVWMCVVVPAGATHLFLCRSIATSATTGMATATGESRSRLTADAVRISMATAWSMAAISGHCLRVGDGWLPQAAWAT